MQSTVTMIREQLGVEVTPAGPKPKGRRRSDSLPEYTPYADDGCDIHDHCLTCPLPRCRYEEPGGLRTLLNQLRDSQILQLRRKGASIDELASRFGVSRRTVFRVLGTAKGDEAARRDATISVLPAAIARAQRRASQQGGQQSEQRCA